MNQKERFCKLQFASSHLIIQRAANNHGGVFCIRLGTKSVRCFVVGSQLQRCSTLQHAEACIAIAFFPVQQHLPAMSMLNLPLHQTIVASTAAGVSSTLLGHPIDTIKVHLQTNPAFASANAKSKAHAASKFPTVRAAQYLLRSNAYSPTVFFRGVGPPIANAAIMNVLTFGVFNRVKDGFGGSSSASLFAGIVSGVASAFVSTPTDYIKISAQLGGGTSTRAILREIMQLPNPHSILFRGHVANLWREGVFTCVYLGIYDVAMSHAQDPNLASIAAISSITGGLAWVVSYPFDTVKSVMQGQAPSKPGLDISHAVRILYYSGTNVGNLSAFYRGCAASTGRAVLVTSSRMITYEFVARSFFRPTSSAASDSHW